MAGGIVWGVANRFLITDMVAREFTLKALQKALSAASISTAENLSAHGQPLYTLQGKVVTAAAAPVQGAKGRAAGKIRRKG